MTRFRIAFALMAVAAVLMFVASRTGGVRVSRGEGDGASVYRISLSMTVLSGAAASLILVAAGLIATAKIGPLRWFAALAAIVGVIGALACWDAATTRLVVGRGQLELPGVRLVGRPMLRVRVDELQSTIVRRQKREVEFVRKDGRAERVPLGTLMREAMPKIEEVLLENGVMVLRF